MSRQITPQSSLDNLKREAKRWLQALRGDDAEARREARARLERAVPDVRIKATEPTLREVQHALAREFGLPGWSALKNRLASGSPADAEDQHRADDDRAKRVGWFVHNACPDHHVRGAPAHVRALHTARRLLERYPELARDSFYTAVVCGDVDTVRVTLTEHPEVANERGGPKGWEPLLYLCFTRVTLPAASHNAVAIATLLLDHGADPNAYFMAGDSRYTPFVGIVGEGEEDRPPHPERDALARLLLERGANPYDIQVVYDLLFHGDVLWFLELIHAHTMRLGREADWRDPQWHMLDMGGYGTGARWMLNIAVRDANLPLAEWVLSHGATPNAAPPRDQRQSQRSLYEDALRAGLREMAELFLRYGADPTGVALDGVDALTDAAIRLDGSAAREVAARHPEYLESPKPLFAAARRDLVDVARLLLDLGVSPDVEDERGQRALHVTGFADAPLVAQLLLDRGADVDAVERRWNNTPLGAAVYAGHRRMIELFSRVSRDIWELVYVGDVERVRELLRAEPDRATVVSGGHTPLMWLPPDDETRALEMAELLLAHGADATMRNSDGETAADRARRLGLFEVAELLDRAAAPKDHPGSRMG